jgi:signal transduction histidine kinase
MMRMAWPGDTVGDMRAGRRLAGDDPGVVVDAGLGIAGAGLIAVAAWGSPRLIGSVAIAGPSWLLALLPLLLGAPLVLRRRAPLLMWLVIWAGIALLFLFAHNSLRGLAFTFVLFAAAYSLGAHASFRRAAAGLILTAPVVAVISYRGDLALAFSQGQGSSATVALSFLQLLAAWLAGVLAYARRRAVSLAARSAASQRQAEQAAAAERARISRELHDIVAHHLSVVVLQAAGARASGKPAGPTLEKIENSARQALAETSRLLHVLRDPDEEAGLAPQPAVAELDALAASVRAAGLPVNLVIDGNLAALPAIVDVSVYRIVQEALTNVLKHAGPARADVVIGYEQDTVTIEVTDNGTGQYGIEQYGTGQHGIGQYGIGSLGGGHGLAGMRERAAVFGGELTAGRRPGGGFAVRARLPLDGGQPPGELS